MNAELVLALALLTYGSRAAALTFLPPLPQRVSEILDRMPPALFAGLAAQSLVEPGAATSAPVLAAAAGALLATPLRSLPACLAAGLAGWALASFVLS